MANRRASGGLIGKTNKTSGGGNTVTRFNSSGTFQVQPNTNIVDVLKHADTPLQDKNAYDGVLATTGTGEGYVVLSADDKVITLTTLISTGGDTLVNTVTIE